MQLFVLTISRIRIWISFRISFNLLAAGLSKYSAVIGVCYIRVYILSIFGTYYNFTIYFSYVVALYSDRTLIVE